MKRIISCCICFLCLSVITIPAFADAPQWIPPGTKINWPPPPSNYTVPSIGYNTNSLEILVQSLKYTLRAIASKSFVIMMIFVLISSIPDIFFMFFIDPFEVYRGVRRRVLNRHIKAEDIKRHRGDIIAEKVRDMELHNEAQQLFRVLHKNDLMEQHVKQMEFNAEAAELYKQRNAEKISQRRISDMSRNFEDRYKFKRDNRVPLMLERAYDMKETASARELYKSENRDSIIARKASDIEINNNARDAYRDEHIDSIQERKARDMGDHLEARALFHRANYENEIQERAYQQHISQKAREYNSAREAARRYYEGNS